MVGGAGEGIGEGEGITRALRIPRHRRNAGCGTVVGGGAGLALAFGFLLRGFCRQPPGSTRTGRGSTFRTAGFFPVGGLFADLLQMIGVLGAGIRE